MKIEGNEPTIREIIMKSFRRKRPLDKYDLNSLQNTYPKFNLVNIPQLFIQVNQHQEQYNQLGRGFILSLCGNGFKDIELSAIGKHRWTFLRQLKLQYNWEIGAAGCNYLSQASLTLLQLISLRLNSVNDQACKYLSGADWKNIKRISLNANQITEKGCKYIAKADWKKLQCISLSRNEISDRGCRDICAGNWPKIKRIRINICGVREEGCRSMAKLNRYLKRLYCDQNIIQVAGYRYLKGVAESIASNWQYQKDDQ